MKFTLTKLEMTELLFTNDMVRERGFLFRDSLTWPQSAVSAGRNWAWVEWQKAKDIVSIRKRLNDVVRNMALFPERIAEANREYFRGHLDWFSLVCAVMSADRSLLRYTAEQAAYADASEEHSGFFNAVSGILKARILGETSAESNQFSLIGKLTAPEPDIGPGAAMMKAFVERDYGSFAKEVKKGVKRHWSDRFVGTRPEHRVIVQQDENEIVLNILRKSGIALWAHCEAVFAKLAIEDGAKIEIDDVWFPLDFILQPFVD